MNHTHGTVNKYRLNALLASVPEDASLSIGKQQYLNPEQLDEIRERLRGTHLVRRSRDDIDIIGYAHDAEIFGETHKIVPAQRVDIGQALLRDWLTRRLNECGFHVPQSRRIEYIAQGPDSNLLAECLGNQIQLPTGIGRRIAADFDVRRIRGTSGRTRLVIVVDVRTRITIDSPVSILMDIGVDPRGRYVQREVTTGRSSYRRLTGRVKEITNGVLVLDDHESGFTSIPAAEAWLEPRQENLDFVIRGLAGQRANDLLVRLKHRVAERVGGIARCKLIDEWITVIRGLPNDVAQNVPVTFGKMAMRTDGGRFPTYEVYEKPQLVFDVGRTKTMAWNQGGLDRFGPYNHERFTPKRLNIAIVCQASKQGDVERFIQKFLDGIPDSRYAEKGFLQRFRLERPFIRIFTARSPAAKHYREAVAAAIDDSTSRGDKWNLALLQIDEIFHEQIGDDNPYLVAKALLLAQQVPSQAFEWESVKPGVEIDATVSNIGLAAYAKVNGIPWLLPVHQTVSHELVVGLGSFEASESRLGGRERYIGVTTVFSSDGRYLLESRTPATPVDEYLNALLAALERVVGEVRRQEAWADNEPVRFVFHVFKDFNHTEITAVKTLMARLRLPHAEFAFVHIVEDHPFMLFDAAQPGVGGRMKKGEVSPPRGLRVDLAYDEALLCLKGPKEVRQWTDGIPKPLLLRLHRESTFRDLSYLARQVFDFSCLSWRTLLPSPLPITVKYSDLVAEKLLSLRGVTGWSPEHILGPVGRGRWFL